ncbi:MAG: N-acetyl-gamma-glutamyl-phosphate reductase [Bdellovibrionales bacterium]|nr:N-acetyl-gamma-glutamyl-phosphate reductase [Bdellovibrionales bacterium]
MSTTKPIGVYILGGTGYGAGELLRVLTAHPLVEVVGVSSRGSEGQPVTKAHPHLEGFYPDLTFSTEIALEKLAQYETGVLVSALPHGASAMAIAELEEARSQLGIKVVDLSGAYRLQDPDSHARYYAEVERPHSLSNKFEYGLTELNSEKIAKATHIANPGCLATASILSVAPISALLSPKFIAFDTKTGSSGSGRELKEATHHPTRHGNFTAYKPLFHQHEPEVLNCLYQHGLPVTQTNFIAQSLPIARGIYVTTHIFNDHPLNPAEVQTAFRDFALRHPFIRYRDTPPHLQHVLGTNFCDLAVAVDDNRIIVMAAIDNLVKGMTGQAVQNINLMAGMPEETGLFTPSLRPY